MHSLSMLHIIIVHRWKKGTIDRKIRTDIIDSYTVLVGFYYGFGFVAWGLKH